MSGFKQIWRLPASLWWLSAASLINRAGTMVVPFLTIYVTEALHFTTAQAGLLVGTYGVGALVISPYIGHLSDTYGPRRVMISSLVLSALVMFAFPLATSFGAIFVFTFVLSVVAEAFRPAAFSAISDYAEGGQVRSAFALYRLMLNIGMSVGPMTGAFLIKRSFTFLFVVDGATSLAAALLLSTVLGTEKSRGTSTDAGKPSSFTASISVARKDRLLVYYLFALFPVVTISFLHESALPLYMVKYLRLDETWYGTCFVVNCVLVILLEIPITVASNHWKQSSCLVIGSCLYGVGLGAMVFATGGAGILATVAIWTFGEMLFFPACASYLAQISPPNKRGFYNGIQTTGFSVAYIAAPIYGTFLLGHFGGQVLWGSCFFLGLLSAFLISRMKD